jgi:NAD(P)-dependent dehydrogenase (short-subunit alcohol dehydrogenase family)
MKIDFTDKRVLVTGGTRGIGRAIVEAFLETGARVAVNGSTAESTARAIAELDAGDRVAAAPGSVATADGCRSIVGAALDALGGLDVLVNNAGVGCVASVEETDEAIWDRVIDTNLKGVFFVTRYALPALRESRGNIVNIASVDGLVGVIDESVYSASKAGVINMTRTHALEFTGELRVNAVCPGFVDTELLRAEAAAEGGSVEAGYRVFAQSVAAQKRIAEAREIAGPVLYLASELASFVTGSIHAVDGGETAD